MRFLFRRTTQTEAGVRFEEVAEDGAMQHHTKVKLGGMVFRKDAAIAMWGAIPDEIIVTVEPKAQ